MGGKDEEADTESRGRQAEGTNMHKAQRKLMGKDWILCMAR